MEKKQLTNIPFYDRILQRLQSMTDDDGHFVYSGDNSDVYDRTGSGLTDLLDYAFERKKEKPIDYDLFREFLVNDLKVPKHRIK
jgi:hypothetical protein